MRNFDYLHRVEMIINVCEEEKEKAKEGNDHQMVLACEISAYNTIKHVIEEYRKDLTERKE